MPPSTRRRWFQFRLRTLLIAILVLSLPLSWFAGRLERARKQRNIVDFVEANGGRVKYDWELRYLNAPPGPEWLHQLLGKDFFGHVHSVDLFHDGSPRNRSGSPALDNELIASAAELPGLKAFAFLETQATDAGLVNLAKARSLRLIVLWGENFTDDGLQYFGGLPELEGLEINNPNVTDAGMRHVGRCGLLSYLYVDSPRITDGGVKYIGELENLQSLFVLHSQATDAGLEYLKNLPSLYSVYVEGSHFSPGGIEAFKRTHSGANNIDLVTKP